VQWPALINASDSDRAAAPPPIEHALTTNQDYFVANKAFFFDLSIWADEAPIDDPGQPLGADRATLLAILKSANSRCHCCASNRASYVYPPYFEPQKPVT
jgi:hypothetical protein